MYVATPLPVLFRAPGMVRNVEVHRPDPFAVAFLFDPLAVQHRLADDIEVEKGLASVEIDQNVPFGKSVRHRKIDRRDLFAQLVAVGMDMVGAITVQETE